MMGGRLPASHVDSTDCDVLSDELFGFLHGRRNGTMDLWPAELDYVDESDMARLHPGNR